MVMIFEATRRLQRCSQTETGFPNDTPLRHKKAPGHAGAQTSMQLMTQRARGC